MKKSTFFIALMFTVFLSCKDNTKGDQKETITADDSELTEKQRDGLTLLKGEFVYHGGAAVLQTHAEIYGVLITDKMHELNKLAEQYKKAPTDMVNVEVRGKISNQKDDKILWENKLEIVEILNIKSAPQEDNNVVKLGS
ncbi:hypothetical protein A8C32_11455 [Flavivirga aquatica]|uniref:NlpE C-terminal OB domain-containing protein n=1 Tax=Flavivirga aquatica TaxID=1849968 RepID=A0A1E5TD74_9FLAO|nr:hypothetical protein [Flavivirga aquatica]OEK09332.1 hypothetical protein A8C32_11455 [Flavivirga aquatica]